MKMKRMRKIGEEKNEQKKKILQRFSLSILVNKGNIYTKA
jgi:hypothetical protein